MTQGWYEHAPVSWIEATRKADMQQYYDTFTVNLVPDATILEIGCGAGRDAKAFSDMGYKVTAIDSAAYMCELTKAYVNDTVEVKCTTIENLQVDTLYDAIWAAAAFVHADDASLQNILLKITQCLKEDGVFYTMFKAADKEWIDTNSRYYNSMTVEKLNTLLLEAGFSNIKITEHPDKLGRSEIWLVSTCTSPMRYDCSMSL